MPLARRLQWALLRHAFRTVVVDDLKAWRGIDLLLASWVFAGALDSSRGERVGIMLPTSGLFPAALLACWQRGRVPVPLNYLASKEELAHVCADAELDACFTVGPMLDLVGGLPNGVTPIRVDTLPRSLPTPRLFLPRRTMKDLAVLLYTSGTSGRPKGVMLSNGNLLANAEQVRAWANFSSRDTLLGVLPQFHSFGLTVLTLLPILIGGKAVYTARFAPRKLIDLATEHRPTAFVAIPSMYNALAQVRGANPDAFKSLRYAVSGAEPLPPAVAERFRAQFGVQIAEGYGLTETSPVTNWCRPDHYRLGSVGPPVAGVDEIIVDSHGRPVPQGAEGEIRLRGPNVTSGYYRRPEETSAAFDERGFFRTGDIGRFDADGHLFITGRLKEMLIISGENVFPREIEEVLERHPGVRAAAVVGSIDPSRGEVPVAFVEAMEGATLEATALRSFAREHLPLARVPRDIHIVDALPRNPTGKVQRRALAERLRGTGPTPQGESQDRSR